MQILKNEILATNVEPSGIWTEQQWVSYLFIILYILIIHKNKIDPAETCYGHNYLLHKPHNVIICFVIWISLQPNYINEHLITPPT